jgi:endonuclease/exonuclease/phosphatase family metal-dependent hydrolase
MRMFGLGSARRLTVATAATLGAALLATTGGQAVADGLTTDPGTLGEAVPGTFVTATLNVLGNSHTAGADPRPSGTTRMAWSVQLLRDNGVDLVGLQELEKPQARAFNRIAGDTYQLFFPGKDPRDAIAFRRDRVELVGTDSSLRIPYRRFVRTMPVVILRDRVTGKRTVVMSVHNVAGKGLKWQRRRNISVRRELAAVTRLTAQTGLPVVFVGDFNDRRVNFYCRMVANGFTSSSTWWSTPAAPTTDPVTGEVTPAPCALPRRAGIDWVWGTPGVTFSGYLKVDGGLVDWATDHPLVLARTSL